MVVLQSMSATISCYQHSLPSPELYHTLSPTHCKAHPIFKADQLCASWCCFSLVCWKCQARTKSFAWWCMMYSVAVADTYSTCPVSWSFLGFPSLTCTLALQAAEMLKPSSQTEFGFSLVSCRLGHQLGFTVLSQQARSSSFNIHQAGTRKLNDLAVALLQPNRAPSCKMPDEAKQMPNISIISILVGPACQAEMVEVECFWFAAVSVNVSQLFRIFANYNYYYNWLLFCIYVIIYDIIVSPEDFASSEVAWNDSLVHWLGTWASKS